MKPMLRHGGAFLATLLAVASAEADLHKGGGHKAFLGIATLEPSGACPVCDVIKVVGKLPDVLEEASGFTASSDHPGTWYAVNDGSRLIFAINGSGAVLSTVNVTGIDDTEWIDSSNSSKSWSNIGDWESTTTGPCTPGSQRTCVFVGDTGNNCAQVAAKNCHFMRTNNVYRILRVSEPDTPFRPTSQDLLGQQMYFEYPDGPHDSEAMVISPEGIVYLIIKDSGVLYELPSWFLEVPESDSKAAATPKIAVARKLASLEAMNGELVTDADFLIGPDGAVLGLTVRTYDRILHYPLPASSSKGFSQSLAKAASRPPCDLSSGRIEHTWGAQKADRKVRHGELAQMQSEDIAWTRITQSDEAAGLLIGSEGGSEQPLLHMTCRLPEAPKAKSSSMAGAHVRVALYSLLTAIVVGS